MGEDFGSYQITVRKEGTGNRKTQQQMAICRELALEVAMDLS